MENKPKLVDIGNEITIKNRRKWKLDNYQRDSHKSKAMKVLKKITFQSLANIA